MFALPLLYVAYSHCPFRNYVDQGTALAQNLTYVNGNTLITRADDWSYLNPNGAGRNSVRLRSNKAYTHHVVM